MTRPSHRPAPDVRVEIRGELPRQDAEYAREQARALAAALGPDTRAARVRLTLLRSRAVTRPAVAQAAVELAGLGPVRVQLAAVTGREAVDVAVGTLVGRAARLRELGEIGFAAVHESSYRPQFTPRPLAERRIVRRKPVVPALRTPDRAARELLALDHGFHLFVDALTGQDSVVHRRPADGGLRLVRAHSTARPGGSGLPLPEARQPVPRIDLPEARRPAPRIDLPEARRPAPRIDLPEAARRLWLGCRPFVFHTDPVDGRGRVLYRRYDGHYGLIAPVTEAP
ncbi:sigma 54 modulation/S30EA ribosomal C-terminal domain-containing protein [Kitasatospora sp. NBC_01560]|uniref:sigma 54 modulation/S30EA ribosomal C-terminal domain-containing protein n=1 Tax=Kitasatospora sp. NBC_01560 TaxID=2975965 RepID=UPI0038667906